MTGHYQEMLEQERRKRELERKLRERQVVRSEEMPWEASPHGLIQHVLNEFMDYPRIPVDAYILVLPPDAVSGRHQHEYEECLYVMDGRGYDQHWDPIVSLDVNYRWSLSEEPSRWDWEKGDFVYIPPMVAHQHANSDPGSPARLLITHNRLYHAMGYGLMNQLDEAAPIDSALESKLRSMGGRCQKI